MKNSYTLEPANYSDYRDFLADRFENLRRRSKTFSLMSCARRSKISKSHLQFLLKKKRHLVLDKFPYLAKALKLTEDEEYFVYLLICKNVSKDPRVNAHFEMILSRLRHQYVVTDTPAPVASSPEHRFIYQDFFAMILHALTRLKGFQEDPKWILENLNVPGLTEDKIKNTLTALERGGALIRDTEGNLVPKEFPFWRPDPLDPHGQDVYRKGAEAVVHLLTRPSYKPSVYMLMALSMDEVNLLKAEKLMIEVHHQLSALAKESKVPTANLYVGNFLMTLARLKAE